MSKKYVIEIKPEYEDSFKGVMLLGAKDSDLYVDPLAVENLEELNSDYINEHYGELQDEAYEDGREVGIKDGMCEAWEAARKIIHMPEGDLLNIFTECYSAVCTALQVLLKYDASEAIAKLKAYEEHKDDSIKAGDIVDRYIDGKFDNRGVYLGGDGDYWRYLYTTGAVLVTSAYPKEQFKRTGKHYDIQSILEAMKNG